MISKIFCMDSGIQLKRFDIREKGIEKVVAEAWGLAFVEMETFNKILLGSVKELNLHLIAFRIISLDSSISRNVALPFFICFSLSARISPCQGGDIIASGFLQRSFHSVSIAVIFSEVVILSKGKAISMIDLPFRNATSI